MAVHSPDGHYLLVYAHHFTTTEEILRQHCAAGNSELLRLILSQYLTNMMHKICFIVSFISCLYMFRAHVLIIRRSKLHYTASGIITPIVKQILCNKLVKY